MTSPPATPPAPTGRGDRSAAGRAPEAIDGIGLLADWVPGDLTFETATPIRWVTVRLTCPAHARSGLRLAEALARRALASG